VMMPAPANVGEHLVLELLVPPLWAAGAVLALAAIVIAVAFLRPAAIARGRRATLLALRLAVVAAAGVLLLGPVIKWQGEERVAGEVALVVDASRSMAIRDVPPESKKGTAPFSEKPEKGTAPFLPAPLTVATVRTLRPRFIEGETLPRRLG